MKIKIIKSFRDDYDCDHLQSDSDINALSDALTKRFLRKDGELFRRMLNTFHLVPNIRLVLEATANEDDEVVALKLNIDRKDLWLHEDIANYDGLMQVMDGYFKQHGLATTHPTTQNELVSFMAWMCAEFPTIDEYIQITD